MPSLPPATRHDLLALASSIDPERAAVLGRDLGVQPGRAVGVLVGTAYPAMRPNQGWQVEAVERIAAEGWRTPRQRLPLRSRLFDVAGDLDDTEGAIRRLRRAVWQEKVRVALRELLPHGMGGAAISVTAAELSYLADAAFEVALAEAVHRVQSRFGTPLRSDGRRSTLVVLGMGKLGGLELNAGSDVDVMFVYDTDDGESKISLHEHWTRVAQRAVSTIDDPSSDGLVWRVDLRLRPEGARGALVNSLAAAERYYETWGRLWERAALLRARGMAGDHELGDQFEREVIIPFVYRRSADAGIVKVLIDLVERSRAELSEHPDRDLKLGPGGIREAEFFVQSLQLVWGGQHPAVRCRSMFEGLARLRSRGLATDREARMVVEAYTLLRSCEHAIQWSAGVQTHELPEAPAERGRLARALGFDEWDGLHEALCVARGAIGDLFRSLTPSRGAAPRNEALLALIDAGSPRLVAAVEAQFGDDIADHLQALARRPDGLLGEVTREQHPALADQVFEAIADCVHPEQGARYLRSFFGRFQAPGPYVSLLAADEHALRRLLAAFGASDFVGEALVARPDLADLILVGGGQLDDPRHVLAIELDAAERSLPEDADDYESQSAFVSATRRAKQAVMVSVAVADLARQISTREATRVLSYLADEMLERVARRVLGEESRGLSIIAMGKLGGQDIGYGSDLDVLFIYDPDAAPQPDEAAEYFARRAQRIMRLLQEPSAAGRGYELDTRLRPSGAYGLLVTSWRSFARYHGVVLGDDENTAALPVVTTSGAAWERQALLRARVCAGDRRLGERVIEVAHVAAYEGGPPDVNELHRLRRRMQVELGKERPGRFDLKVGRGGLLDIEFATQWLQMQHGRDPAIRTTDTVEALEALRKRGYLSPVAFETFSDGYYFLRRLEQRIHILRGAGSTVLDAADGGLELLARRMGLQRRGATPITNALLAKFHDVTDAVRSTYLDVLGVDEEPSPE